VVINAGRHRLHRRRAHDETVEVAGPMRALKLEASALFDVIEHHPDSPGALIVAVFGHACARLAPAVATREAAQRLR